MRKIGEKSTGSTSDKITGLKDIREQIDKIEKLFQKLKDKDQLQCLEILGVG